MLIKDWVVTCHFSFAMIINTFANLTTDNYGQYGHA